MTPEHYRDLLGQRFAGRKVILAMGMVSNSGGMIELLRSLGAEKPLLLAEGIGTGAPPSADELTYKVVGTPGLATASGGGIFAKGGAVYGPGGSVTVNSSTISDNSAAASGGASSLGTLYTVQGVSIAASLLTMTVIQCAMLPTTFVRAGLVTLCWMIVYLVFLAIIGGVIFVVMGSMGP